MAILLSVTSIASGGCGESCEIDATYNPPIDPAAFATMIDNPWFPLTPGRRYVYEGGGETVEVSVTSEQKVVLGIAAVVVRDTVTKNAAVVEDTLDWYAQDSTGNVWYLGEDTKEYEGGKVVDTEGSWEAGVDGAKPGIIMKAHPSPTDGAYRQEYYACEAEDEAQVLSTDETVTVPFGSYTGCLKTRDFTRLEPTANEHKYYCPGVGLVLEVDVASGDRLELISVTSL